MAQAVVKNPILNSPFDAPGLHHRFDEDGITNEVMAGRRDSEYLIPTARSKKKGKQLAFDTEWTADRIEKNELVNRIRPRVDQWRAAGYAGVTTTTARLLEHWRSAERAAAKTIRALRDRMAAAGGERP